MKDIETKGRVGEYKYGRTSPSTYVVWNSNTEEVFSRANSLSEAHRLAVFANSNGGAK